LVSFAVVVASAQNISGTITGTVDDPAGARVLGASVLAVNEQTGVRFPTSTNEAGVYVLAELPLGNYTLSIEASGFKTYVRANIALGADARMRVDAALELGNTSDKVTVTAEAPLLESERATLGGSFRQELFDNLPVGRDPLATLQLVPGSQPSQGGFATGVFNGSHEETTDYKVDGTASTLATTYRAPQPPILEMVEEVVLQSSNYSAEYGRGASQISVNTISGTNQLHGVLYEYFSNEDLDANSFFNNLRGIPRSLNRQNLFGATVAGPLVLPKIYNGRNRTFFSFGYQGTRSYVPVTATATLPSAAMRSGNFAGQPTIMDPATTVASGSSFARTPFPNNIIPLNRQDPVALRILQYAYPLPNGTGAANNYTSAGSSPLSNTSMQGRLDENITEKHRVTARLNRWYQTVFNFMRWPGPAGVQSVNNVQNNDTQNTTISAEYVYLIKPDMINTFRFGYYVNRQNLFGPGTDENWAGIVGLKGAGPQKFPSVSITGLAGFGGANLTRSLPGANYTLGDTMLMIKGRHSLKLGFEYRYLQDQSYTPGANPSGNFTFNTQPTNNPANQTQGVGFASFLLGIPTNSGLSVYPNAPFLITWPYYALFVQDDFRVSRTLTLNLGLRWEMNLPFKEQNNYMSSFNLKTQQLDLAGRNGYPDTLFDAQTKNFQPRIGFAWSPFANSKTVVRGGYGIFFLPNNAIGGAPFTQGPWAQNLTFQSPDGVTFPITLSGGFPAVDLNAPLVIGPTTGVNTVARQYTPPYMQMWNMNIQRQIRGNILVEAGWVGNNGHHLASNVQLNQVPANLLGPGNAQARRPYPNVGSIRDGAGSTPIGNSTYEALQARFQYRMRHGVTAQAAYTFSKTIDQFQGNGSFGSFTATNTQDYYNLRAEKSVALFDQTNLLSWAWISQVPFGKGRAHLNHGGVLNALVGGWNLSSISNMQTGMPLVMGVVQNLTGSLDGGSRPNRLRNGALSGEDRGINKWFDPAAFALPPAYAFGNDSRTEPQLRAPGTVNISGMLQKEFRFAEKRWVEFRCQAGNALNHFNPGMPNTTIGGPGVGTITGGNGGRSLQLALKLHY